MLLHASGRSLTRRVEQTKVEIVMPAHQFPLNRVLAAERRRGRWRPSQPAARAIENDHDAEFVYDGPAIGAI
jgi:DNA-binding transcriptional MocR family regulator